MLPRQQQQHYSAGDLRWIDRHSPMEYARAIVKLGIAYLVFLLLLVLLFVYVFLPFTFTEIATTYLWFLIATVVGIGISFVLWLSLKTSQTEIEDIGQFGSVIRSGLPFRRKEKVYAPRAPLSTVSANRETKQAALKIPRLLELLPDGLTALEENLLGYGLDGLPVFGEWYGVTAVIGAQNVGKSVTLVLLIAIALLRGMKVTVCDIHAKKERSLFKKIKCLEPFITFATTEQEILEQVKLFIETLYDQEQQHLFVIDEYNRLIEKFAGEELRELLPEVINKAGREGHGYGKYLALAIHDLSDQGLGNSRLRGWFNFVYGHRIKQEQSHFVNVFNNKKMATELETLPRGHVYTSDKEHLIVPFSDKLDVDKLCTLLKTLNASSGGYENGYAPAVLKEEKGEV